MGNYIYNQNNEFLSNNDKIKKSLELILQDRQSKLQSGIILYGINLNARNNHCAICDHELKTQNTNKHLICFDCIYQSNGVKKCIVFNQFSNINEQYFGYNKYITIYGIEKGCCGWYDLCWANHENKLLFNKNHIFISEILNKSDVLLNRYLIYGLKHLKYMIFKHCEYFNNNNNNDIKTTIFNFYLSLFC